MRAGACDTRPMAGSVGVEDAGRSEPPFGSAQWLADIPLSPGPPDLAIGVRRVDPADWLPIDELAGAELAHKAHLLGRETGLVQRLAGHEAAERELYQLVCVARGVAPRDDVDPLEAASMLVVEDLCLMARTEGAWHLVAGSLVFPNQWTLDQMLGRPLAAIHRNIDGYDDLLAAQTDRFFDRLAVGTVVTRRNWFLHRHGVRYQPEYVEPLELRELEDVAGLFVRSERQTLRRLPETDAIAFTIRTQIAPISEVAARPDVAAALVEWLEAASPRARAGKDIAGRWQVIRDYLATSMRSS